MKIGDTFKLVLWTGSGERAVNVTISEILDDTFVKVTFPHPTVRHFMANQIIEKSRLREKSGNG